MELSSVGNSFMMQAQMARHNSISPAINIDMMTAGETEIWNAAVEFEAYFIQVMFREMRNTVNRGEGIIPQSHAEEIFQDMLDEQTARSAAESGGIGLAQQIFRQFSESRSPVAAHVLAQSGYSYNGEYGADQTKQESI